MGLTDKLKDLGKQAQGVVADHREDIHHAVGSVSSAANQRTHGKYAEKIARAGGKLTATVDKLGGAASEQAEAEGATATAEPPAAEQPADGAESKPAGDAPEFE